MFAMSSEANKNKEKFGSSHISNSAVKTQILSKKPTRSLSADAGMSKTAGRQCLLAQAEDAESQKLTQEETEGMIIGEFGRCLKQIIDMANKAAAGIKAADG